MSALHCPTCRQQVAPGMRCWSCGTEIPRSAARIAANIGACLLPFTFCLAFGGLQVWLIKTEEDKRKKAEAEKRLAAEEAATKANPPAKPRGPAPEVPWGTVYTVRFDTEVGLSPPGLAFVVGGVGERPAILTTKHLLTLQAGGILEPKNVRSVQLLRAFGDGQPLKLGAGYRALPERESVLALDPPRGVAWVDTLRLASSSPEPGDPLWLVAPIPGTEARLHPVTAGRRENRQLPYVFERRDLKLDGTYGAPVINGAGEVVGVHIGSLKRQNLVGVATPAADFAPALRKVLKRRPATKTPKKTRAE